jgi:hypothetical protein
MDVRCSPSSQVSTAPARRPGGVPRAGTPRHTFPASAVLLAAALVWSLALHRSRAVVPPGVPPVPETVTVTNEVIALSGAHAPGGLPGETFGPLTEQPRRINARGDVAFIAPVLGIRADGTPVDAVFLRTSRGVLRIAQGDAPPPGLPAPVLGRELSHLSLNEAGHVAFVSRDPENGEAIVSNASGSWQVVASSLAPTDDGLRFGEFSPLLAPPRRPLLLRSGPFPDVLFPARGGGTATVNLGIWTASADGWDPRPLFGYDRQAPDLGPSQTLDTLTEMVMGAAPARRSAYSGELHRAGNEDYPTNQFVIWTGTGRGPIGVAARSGEPAPVETPGVFYSEFRSPRVNAAGSMAFIAELVHNGSQIGGTVFVGTPDRFIPILRDGDPVRRRDGSEAGPFRYPTDCAINAAGQVLIQGAIADNHALVRWTPGGPATVVTESGGTWAGGPAGWSIQRLAYANFNASGRAAFFAGLDIPGAEAGHYGLWVTDATDNPVLVALYGSAVGPFQGVPPPGVLVLDFSYSTYPFSGGEDGLPRFLSDGNQIVHDGRLANGTHGIFLGRIEPVPTGPPDETFELSPPPERTWAALAASDPTVGTLSAPTLLFPDAGVLARTDKDWSGARLSVDITENLAETSDLLGFDVRAPERQRVGPAPNISQIQYLGATVGDVARPRAGALEVTFRATATTDAVRAVIRSVAFGSRRSHADALRTEPRLEELPRRVRLRLTDAGGRSGEIGRRVEFPRTRGLAFEGCEADAGGMYRSWDSSTTPVTRLTLKVQLVLDDGTRLTLGCAPSAAEVQWFPNAAAEFRRETDNGSPCASAELGIGGLGGFPSVVRLHSWEAYHLLRREENLAEYFNHGYGVCLGTFFNLWIASQFDGAQPSRPALASTSGTDSGLPRGITAGPYALRAWMRQSAEGRRLTALFETHTREVTGLLVGDFTLFNDTLTVLRQFLPGLQAFLAGNGNQVTIRPEMIDQLNRVWDRLASSGSPALRQVLEQERTRFHGFQEFSGRSFAEWGTLLGWGTPETPFVIASNPAAGPSGFRVEANRADGQSYSLWKSSRALPGSWSPVTNASLRVLDLMVELTDPEPVDTARFYQVRTTPAGTAR